MSFPSRQSLLLGHLQGRKVRASRKGEPGGEALGCLGGRERLPSALEKSRCQSEWVSVHLSEALYQKRKQAVLLDGNTGERHNAEPWEPWGQGSSIVTLGISLGEMV